MTDQGFRRIAIIGIGLIGSSIARAAREKGAAAEIALFDRDAEVRARAAELGLGDVAGTAEAAVSGAELVILCVPVGAMREAAEAAIAAMAPGAILSDVGSVKGSVARDLAAAVGRADVHLIPGHPIAGTEKSGPDAGFPSLFEGRWFISTPDPAGGGAYLAAADRLEAFWRALGSKVERMDPQRHDLVLAVTSHVPHLIAYNIVATAYDMETVTEGEVVKFSAAGFRDFTRIASSDPTMWRDVFLNNREAVIEVLGRFTEDLIALQRAIRWGEGDTLFDLFTHARGIRRSIIEAGQDSPAPNWGRDGGKR
jgi:cyclohexadieny/prephenate dehydrogenase